MDPYLLWQSGGSLDWYQWPDVEDADIYNFIIESPSLYTGESLKAYKSLDAYNFFVSGWVDSVYVAEIQSCKHTYLVSAHVRHSQRISASPTKAWMAVKQDGRIICAHCTCMAGLGEACSHMAAVLFTFEANTQTKKTFSTTSLPCSWLPPSFRSVPFARLAEINFSTPLQKRRQIVSPDNSNGSSSRQRPEQTSTPAPTEEEVQGLYSQLTNSVKPVLLSLVPTY